MTPASLVPGFQLAVRAALGAAAAVALAEVLALRYPIYAMIAAVIVTDLSPAQTRQLGAHRVVGTVLGATLGAGLGSLLPSGPFTVALGILLAMLGCQLLLVPNAAKVTGYICGILLLEHRAEPWSYALARTIETLLGIAVAMLVSLVPKLIRTRAVEGSDPREASAQRHPSPQPDAAPGDVRQRSPDHWADDSRTV